MARISQHDMHPLQPQYYAGGVAGWCHNVGAPGAFCNCKRHCHQRPPSGVLAPISFYITRSYLPQYGCCELCRACEYCIAVIWAGSTRCIGVRCQLSEHWRRWPLMLHARLAPATQQLSSMRDVLHTAHCSGTGMIRVVWLYAACSGKVARADSAHLWHPQDRRFYKCFSNARTFPCILTQFKPCARRGVGIRCHLRALAGGMQAHPADVARPAQPAALLPFPA